jgi:glycosyltransferase involved in cell wall biosynthesis
MATPHSEICIVPDAPHALPAHAGQSPEGLVWLRDFAARNGRPLRVLHIGNIANNAYNNAKIQREFGIEADVICADYYHIMSCPEWEDADFVGSIANSILPDWWAVDLNGFRRPRWFVQGPGTLCRYHLMQRKGTAAAALTWAALETARWIFVRQSAAARLLREAVLRPGWRGLRLARSLTRAVASAIRCGRDRRAAPEPNRAVAGKPPSAAAFQDLCALAVRAFARYFPGRRDRLSLREIGDYADFPAAWAPLLARYDVIQAYATAPAIPLVCGSRNFAAYEHGTIRDIPFQDTAEGRICAISYREAPAVFVTNSDNLDAAGRLGIADDRLFCLPHAFDDAKLRRFAEENHSLRPDPAGCVFFSPARHHWTDRDPGLAKGNDVLLRALPLVRRQSSDFRLVLIEWGRDVAATKRLLSELRCSDLVEWIPVLKKRDLWGRYLRSHAVIDQFVIPALGGIAFEAMALGTRVVTALDITQAARFFGEAPPLFSCCTPDDVARAMLQVIADPGDARLRGLAARRWIEQYHSARRIVDIQGRAYRRILEGQVQTSFSRPD